MGRYLVQESINTNPHLSQPDGGGFVSKYVVFGGSCGGERRGGFIGKK
jgi:hypothetical protein